MEHQSWGSWITILKLLEWPMNPWHHVIWFNWNGELNVTSQQLWLTPWCIMASWKIIYILHHVHGHINQIPYKTMPGTIHLWSEIWWIVSQCSTLETRTLLENNVLVRKSTVGVSNTITGNNHAHIKDPWDDPCVPCTMLELQCRK